MRFSPGSLQMQVTVGGFRATYVLSFQHAVEAFLMRFHGHQAQCSDKTRPLTPERSSGRSGPEPERGPSLSDRD